jgi:RNA polymerase sigma-70 factor (ECF subfamily)
MLTVFAVYHVFNWYNSAFLHAERQGVQRQESLPNIYRNSKKPCDFSFSPATILQRSKIQDKESGIVLLGVYLSMLETEEERKRMSDIYEKYQMTCLFAAKSVLRDDDWLAEDAVHNTWLNLIKKKELLLLPDNVLRPLLITIVKRRATDLYRQKTRKMSNSLDEIEDIPSPEKSVEVQILNSEDFNRLIECIKSMEEHHRSILQMKYYLELSNTEIGKYFGITNRQVTVQLYNAKKKLRDYYCGALTSIGWNLKVKEMVFWFLPVI